MDKHALIYVQHFNRHWQSNMPILRTIYWIYWCGSECAWAPVGTVCDRVARLVQRLRLPRQRRRRHGCGLFNKTAITPDMVMYCIARRDLSTAERLPVGLYAGRIFQCRHVTCPPSTNATHRLAVYRKRSAPVGLPASSAAQLQYKQLLQQEAYPDIWHPVHAQNSAIPGAILPK